MKKKTRLLVMINNLYGGGAEKILQTFLRHLDSERYHITLYSVKHEKLDESIYGSNINTFRCVYNGGENSGPFFILKNKLVNKFKLLIYNYCSPNFFYKLFVKGTYDIEIAFIEGYSTRIISGSPNKLSKKYAWVHIDLFTNHWTKICYKNLTEEINCYQKFNNIVCVSNGVKKAFSKKFDIHTNIVTRYNPIDSYEIVEKSELMSVDDGFNGITIVTVGRLEPQKGYDRLLEIAKRLKSEAYNFRIQIVGEGNERNNLENYIELNHIGSVVQLLGFQSNPYPYIKNSDLFVCSSRSEGISTVVTEALILGKPIISTRCSGVDELLGDNIYGIITENSTEDLYQGMKNIISSKDIRDELSVRCEKRKEDFKVDAIIEQIESLWN